MSDGDLVPMPDRRVEPIPVDERPPTPAMSTREILVEGVKMVPNLAKLVYRLMRDPRVPKRRKWLVMGAGAYLISPIDLVPELLLPVIGQVDDLLLAVFAVNHLLAGVDRDVLDEYWDGHGDALELVRAFVEWAAELLPPPLDRWLTR